MVPGSTQRRQDPPPMGREEGERTPLVPLPREAGADRVLAAAAPSRKNPWLSPKRLVVGAGAVAALVAAVWIHPELVGRAAVVAIGGSERVGVKCKDVYMPDLTAATRFYRYSRVCYPDDGKKHPLHFFAHGDFGGGPFSFAYRGIVNDIASRGFVVSMYLSCAIDQQCDDGNASFLEILKSMSFLETEAGWWTEHIDFDAGYSASGHSTGGRAVLMLAALVDNPTRYLAVTKYASMITEAQRTSLQKFRAVVGDHPDPIYLPGFNPDVANFVVDKTPTMIVTGTNDYIEPELSAWKDFEAVSPTANKLYVDMKGTGHLGPLLSHKEGPYIAYFCSCFLGGPRGGDGACDRVFGTSGAGAMRNAIPMAAAGDRNTGDGAVGFLGCRRDKGGGESVPEGLEGYCKQTLRR